MLGFAIAALVQRVGSSDLVEDVLDATGDLVVVATVSTIVLLLRAGLLFFIVQVFFDVSGFINVVTWIVVELVFVAARLLDLIARRLPVVEVVTRLVATRIILEVLGLVLEVVDVLTILLEVVVLILVLEVLSLVLEVVGLGLSLNLFLFLVAL